MCGGMWCRDGVECNGVAHFSGVVWRVTVLVGLFKKFYSTVTKRLSHQWIKAIPCNAITMQYIPKTIQCNAILYT